MEIRERLAPAVGLEIEACPFCERSARATSLARLLRHEDGELCSRLQVCCLCGAAGPACATLAEAVAAWNAAWRGAPLTRVAV
jgi:hypothetical protein